MVESALNAALIHFSSYDVNRNYRIENDSNEEDGYDEDMDANHDDKITLLEYMEAVYRSNPEQFQVTEREKELAESLDQLLNSSDPVLCARAAKELGELKDLRAVKALIQAYNRGSCRAEIISSLTAIAEETQARDFQSQIQTGQAVSLAGPANRDIYNLILEALNDPDREVQVEAIKSVRELRLTAATEALISKLRLSLNEEDSPGVILIDALESIKNPTNAARINDVLVEALGSQNFEVKFSAALALSGTEDQRRSLAASILLQSLDNASPSIQEKAIVSLGRIGEPEAIPRLIEFLKNETPESVRSAAVDALSRIGPDAIPCLVSLIGDLYFDSSAIFSVLHNMETEAIPILRDILNNNSIDLIIRLKVCQALLNLGDSSVLPVLQTLMLSIDYSDLSGASLDLNVLWESLHEITKAHSEIKDQMTSFLITIWNSDLYPSYFRGAAIKTLGEIISSYYESSYQFLSIVIDAAANTNLPPAMRWGALEGLGEIANNHPELRDHALSIILQAMENLGVDLPNQEGYLAELRYFFSPVDAFVNLYRSNEISAELLDDETAKALIAIMKKGGRGRINVVNALTWFGSESFSRFSADTARELFKVLKRIIRNNPGLREAATISLRNLWGDDQKLENRS